MKTEVITLNEARNVTLSTYIQEVGGKFANISKRPAIIIIPGGGYQYCSDREAEPVAFTYLKAGYQVFVLRYSVNKDATWPNPLSDYEQAMDLVRGRADEWNIYEDRIAVAGFSAGGHLAASAATMSRNRPNAAILGYAVTMEYLAKLCEKTAPDVISAVDKDTCPCFVFSSRTDTTVPIENSTNFINALVKHDISFESHIYSYGPHGFSTADSSVLRPGTEISNRTKNWVNDSIEWLKEVFGDFGDGKMTEPKYKNKVVDDTDEYLSLDCTMGLLKSNDHANKLLKPIFQKQMEEMKGLKKWESLDKDLVEHFVNKMTLRSVLEFAKVNQGVIKQFDTELSKIPNDQ